MTPVRFGNISLLVGLIFILVTAYSNPQSQTIRSDGLGYYSYLPAIFIERDVHFEGLAKPLRKYRYISGDSLPSWTGITRHSETGIYLNKYLIGVAVLELPFFAIGHVAATFFGMPADGYSQPYQLAVAGAAIFYLIVGLVLIWRVLEERFESRTVILTLGALLVGTNLLHYATFDASFSHIYSFALVAAFLFLTERWSRSPSIPAAAALGAVFGLILLVRPTNAFVALLPIFYGVSSKATLYIRTRTLWRNSLSIATAGLTAALITLPQLLIWRSATGHWIVDPYPGEGFCFARPAIVETLFSVPRGVLFWSPVLLWAIPGLWILRRFAREFSFGVSLCVALFLYITSSWCAWHYGEGFGHRAFVDILPILALPLASSLALVQRSRFRGIALILIGGSILLSLHTMKLYWDGRFDSGDLSWDEYRRTVFGMPIARVALKLDEHCRPHRLALQIGSSCTLRVHIFDDSGEPASEIPFIVERRQRLSEPWTVYWEGTTNRAGVGEISVNIDATAHYRARASWHGRDLTSRVQRLRAND